MSTWPHSGPELFVDPAHTRPIFQGDIFDDVPFVKVRAGNSPDTEPNLVSERRSIALTHYPCDMYESGRGDLARVQAVCLVREAGGMHIPSDWNGAYSVCPLPDFRGDGRLWIADFRAVGNVDRSFLTLDRRAKSLTQLGWAFFRRRLVQHQARIDLPLDRLREAGRATWDEALLWQEWSAAGAPREGFHPWFGTEQDGGPPRALVERGETEVARQRMRSALEAARAS